MFHFAFEKQHNFNWLHIFLNEILIFLNIITTKIATFPHFALRGLLGWVVPTKNGALIKRHPVSRTAKKHNDSSQRKTSKEYYAAFTPSVPSSDWGLV